MDSYHEYLRRLLLGSFGARRVTTRLSRAYGFPVGVDAPLFQFETDSELKDHPEYAEAKAGSVDAAIQLVWEVTMPLIAKASSEFPEGAIYVAPHAIEATGDNAIPQVLATALALTCRGEVDESIVQAVKVFHTGADPMERINLRPFFDGSVVTGGRYVLVDDVSTMGGTLAELSKYIQMHGGVVIGAVVIVNASRSGRLRPTPKNVRLLEGRFGNEIREIFGIEPNALTADEASYLIGFRNADEIRGRSAKAREETDLRLRAKGVFAIEEQKTWVVTQRRMQMARADDARRRRRRGRKSV